MTDTTEAFNGTNRLDPNSEKLKLIKNTKGYNWEIVILSTDIDRIESINDEMLKRSGGCVE